MSLSSITVSGTITKDAEQRFTPNNVSVVSVMIKIARYDNKAKQEKFFPVKVNLWGDNYTQLMDRLKTGARVLVSGRLQIDQFQDRNGKNVRLTVVEASSLHLLEDLSKELLDTSSEQSFDAAPAAAPMDDSFAPSASEEEIPF